MRSNPWTLMILAAVVIGSVAVGALLFEPKNDGPFEKLGERIDKVVK